jgi:UDP-GlcNAc:undecaprenyl-phosphate GlcNAc-1-phosphate transferase
MNAVIANPFFVTFTAAFLSAVLTWVVREGARKFGFVAKPKADRWHTKPTALMGGVAIYAATILVYLILVPKTPGSIVVMGGATFLFLVGLIDDILFIKPYQKIIGQVIGTAIIIGSGMTLPITGMQIIDIWITAFWLIGITNAVNLLDNMDGLAAGIAAIAAVTLAIGFASGGDTAETLLICGFIGALLGFLVFNFNPASIFMGDAGSLFIGFLLAGSVMLNQGGGRSRGIVTVLAVPALILFVPIFDTTLVTILRKLWGRKASEGGRDHTSHRLVALGLTERSAVLMLYGFAILAAVLSIYLKQLRTVQSFALLGFFIVVLTILGVYLAKVKVYAEQEEDLALTNNAVFGFIYEFSHKRRVFEVLLDSLLITLAYYFSYVLLFGSFEQTANWTLFIETLPLLIVIKLAAFLVVGVYRGIWRYTSISDLVTFTKGVVVGSVGSVLAILLLYRFKNFSRAVFIVDGLLLLAALAGSRMAFRLIRQMLPNPVASYGRRVLIYGAGDGGEMVLRELENNPEWECTVVGFLDDDPMKVGKMMHGLKVLGGNGSLAEICREYNIQEVLISVRESSPEWLKEVRIACQDADVSLKRAMMRIEPVEFE